ncbi:hypothetical protein [Streptomyces sp. HNM0575]|uniref:hypothetical protein n=1 Tax=Streptomyces sp. HNM0575 TaxID=2716338 RepID=UPI001F0D01ED|nr:hypothetical protein [Streptomyces sp. HNM0575]
MPVPDPATVPQSPASSPTGRVPCELKGLWRRTLLTAPGAPADTTTHVSWLQGRRCYADLRQPAGFAHAPRTRGLTDLTRAQLACLARQEAFAGELSHEGDVCHWHHSVDLQPPAAFPDSGRVRTENGLLVEEGVHETYTEHWRREISPGIAAVTESPHDAAAPTGAPLAGALLHEPETGRAGVLVRAGPWFAYARGRNPLTHLPAGASLAELVAGAASVHDARRLLDCEVSLGRVRESGWHLSRSTLPGRTGRRFMAWASGSDGLHVSDLASDGTPVTRSWRITGADGPLSRLLPHSGTRGGPS